MSELKVVTIDRDYHVDVAAREAAVRQILPCQRDGGNIIDPYVVAVMEDNDTPFDNGSPVLNENFCGENFCEFSRNRKICESFHP